MSADFDTRVSNLELDLDPATAKPEPAAPAAPMARMPSAPTVRQPIPVLRATSQDAERVDATGAARATSDEQIAKSLGFSPKPPVYEIGTVVNSIGVENFRRSRQDWDKLPGLPELAKSFTDRVAAEQRKDLLVDATSCSVAADGRIHGFNGQPHLMSERALNGLATHVTPGGASYLRECPSDLRATNLNHWLKTAEQRDARASKQAGKDIMKPKQLTMRTRARKGGTREVFSVVGPKYAAFDVDAVAREAAKGIGGDARGTITYDGYRMTLDAMFHSNIAPEHAVAGEFFKGCVRVQTADDGSGSIRCSLGLWRNLCRNLIIVDFDKVLVGSRKHIGTQTIAADVAELMTQASERIKLIVGKWSEANTENVIDRYDLQDVDEVFRGLVLNDCVHVTGYKGEDLVKRLHESWEREPGYSKASILNAITRAAHEQEWKSWADTEELESAAGELLYQQVWNLDIAERTAEEVLA